MDPELFGRAESFWRARSRECFAARSSLRPEPRLAEIHARHADLFDAGVLASLAAELGAPGAKSAGDVARRRKLLGLLVEGRVGLLAGDALDRRLAWEATAVVGFDGEEIPVRLVQGVLADCSTPRGIG